MHDRMVYGLVTRDYFPLFGTYFVGFVAGGVYVAVYYHYTIEKVYARRVVAGTLALTVVVTAYAILGESGVLGQSAHDVEQVMGYVVTGTSVVLYTSPLETIARVIKTKSAASIPVLMCACASVSNTFWITYGLLEHDAFVWGLGVFCMAFALVQVALYVVYNPKKLLGRAGDSVRVRAVFHDTDKHDLAIAIAIESPCFTAIKSPLAPLH